MDCPNDINFDTYISEERYIEILDQSKDEEDDTCIEKNKITMNQPPQCVSLSSAFSLSLNKSSISQPSSVRALCICHSSNDRDIFFVPFHSDEVWSKSL
jgi:hypothetical protein